MAFGTVPSTKNARTIRTVSAATARRACNVFDPMCGVPYHKTSGTKTRTSNADNILIFGGTSEGRELAFFCESKAIPVYVCVAGDYGSRALGNLKHVRVIEGRKDAEAILGLIKELDISRV